MSEYWEEQNPLVLTDKDIYEEFKHITGFTDADVDIYSKAGKNSIRVRFVEGAVETFSGEIIFTYYSDKYWRLESINAYFYLV